MEEEKQILKLLKAALYHTLMSYCVCFLVSAKGAHQILHVWIMTYTLQSVLIGMLFTSPGREVERKAGANLQLSFGSGLSCEKPVCEKLLDNGPSPSRVAYDSPLRSLSALRSFKITAGRRWSL